jgi:hypothetical protein
MARRARSCSSVIGTRMFGATPFAWMTCLLGV